MATVNIEELKAGLMGILTDTIKGAREDATADISEYVQRIALRAAQYGMLELKGDPGAAQEMEHVKAQVNLIAAIVHRREAERISAAILQAIGIVVKFLISAGVAAI